MAGIGDFLGGAINNIFGTLAQANPLDAAVTPAYAYAGTPSGPSSQPAGPQFIGTPTTSYGNQNISLPSASVNHPAAPTTQAPQQQQQTFDPYAALRNQISSGWDSYMGQLNDVLNNGLPQQQTSQDNIINDQYNQGVNTANTQKAASLKDIANTIKNAFQAGNIYLGSRGAGDSSAANQYSFAINQEANKQNSNLNDFVNTQLNNLGSQRDQQLNQVANWYANAQNQLKQAIANGSLGKSQDLANLSSGILNQGLGMINGIQQDAQAKYNALVQWAANNSGSLSQLQSNIASIPQPVSGIQLDSSGNLQVPVGYGYSNSDQQNKAPVGYGTADTTQSNGLFSNPAWFQ